MPWEHAKIELESVNERCEYITVKSSEKQGVK
jgi:hypothetical protein